MTYVMQALKDRRESYDTSASGLTHSLPTFSTSEHKVFGKEWNEESLREYSLRIRLRRKRLLANSAKHGYKRLQPRALRVGMIVSPSGERLRLFVRDDEWLIASFVIIHLLTASRNGRGNPDPRIDSSGRNSG
jgi:hypothetical protein